MIFSPHLPHFVGELPVLVALQKYPVVISIIFFTVINIAIIAISTDHLEYVGGSSVFPSDGCGNVARKTLKKEEKKKKKKGRPPQSAEMGFG